MFWFLLFHSCSFFIWFHNFIVRADLSIVERQERERNGGNQKNICDFYEIYIWFSLLKIPERNYDELMTRGERGGWREGRWIHGEENSLNREKKKKGKNAEKSFYIKVISFLRLFRSSYFFRLFIYLQSTRWWFGREKGRVRNFDMKKNLKYFPFFSHWSISRHDCYVWFSFPPIWIHAQYINLGAWKAKYSICLGCKNIFPFNLISCHSILFCC